MMFLRLLYGAVLGLGLLYCICLQETIASIQSVGTQTSLGFPSCKPVKVLNAPICTYVYTYKYKKTLFYMGRVFI